VRHFISVLCLCGALFSMGCSDYYHHVRSARTKVEFGTLGDVHEARGGGPREVFMADRAAINCTTLENIGTSALSLYFFTSSDDGTAATREVPIRPGQTSFVCGESERTEVACDGPSCNYRWSTRSSAPELPNDFRAPGIIQEATCCQTANPPADPGGKDCSTENSLEDCTKNHGNWFTQKPVTCKKQPLGTWNCTLE
jgi:hypothetical protein